MKEDTSIWFGINGYIHIKQPRASQNNMTNVHGNNVTPDFIAGPSYMEGDPTAFFDCQWGGVYLGHVIGSWVRNNLESCSGDSIDAATTIDQDLAEFIIDLD